jgi:alpha-glucosidase
MKKVTLALALLLCCTLSFAQKTYQLKSPDGKLNMTVSVGRTISYALSFNGSEMVSPSAISMHLDGNQVFGINSKLKSAKTTSHNGFITTFAYKKDKVSDNYNELLLQFKNNFNLIFRAYNEGVAYRFVSTLKKDFKVMSEEATFNFAKDWTAFVPYVKEKRLPIEQQFNNSFENTYTHCALSKIDSQRLIFSPFVVEADGGVKLCIAESDLESYPGMFVRNDNQSTTLKGAFATVPKDTVQGGHNNLQRMVESRYPFIAQCKAGQTNFPWRIINVAAQDKDLLNNDMVYRLAAPSRFKDTSWIKPGKVAWDWWNDWGVYHVNFETGVNTATYKAYIDFASKNKIEYVILDEGWAVNGKADLFEVVPEIDLKEIIRYAKSKNVEIILWAGYYAFNRDMEHVCKYYSEMGVKGFKIDFMDHDDQPMVDFHYRAASVAAKYHLMCDFHGTYKPTGLNRTYPNVINFEGVNGLEQMKWAKIEDMDEVVYDVTIPYIRMVAGSLDYTQGAMRNSTRDTYRPVNSDPMSQGTRCHQLAEYVIFTSPLNMLCDSPTHYEEEQECTDFMAAVPTVWNETLPLDGKIGEYVAVARRHAGTWYVGATNNWTARTLTLDLSFLGKGTFVGEVFSDGVNANKMASDYLKTEIEIPANRQLTINMAQGGGWVMKIIKK